MSWGFPPQVEETINSTLEPKILSKKIVEIVKNLKWTMEVEDDNFLYFTNKKKNKLGRFFFRNEKTDIMIKISENGYMNISSSGPSFILDGGINRKNLNQLKKELNSTLEVTF